MLLRSQMNAACGDRLWWSSWLYLSYEIDAPWSFFVLKLHRHCSGTSISGCPISWGREVSCWCTRASPKVSGLPQLGMIPATFLTSCIRQAILWGKKIKIPAMQGIGRIVFLQGKEVHISVDGYPPLFWKIVWLGHKHVDTLPHGEETRCACLKMSSSSLC